MNTTIYLVTIRKILRHKFILAMLVFMGILLPVSMIIAPEGPDVSTVEGWDAFAVSTLIGLITVTASNAIGNALTLGGRSDYMPLIVTRPLHRFQYVLAKWLALATIIGVTSLVQQLLFFLTGTLSRWGLTNEMIMLGFVERIVSALSVSSVLTMIYLFPSQTMVLCGVIAFEVATIFSIFALNLTIPLPETSTDVTNMIASILGVDEWARSSLLPAIFGGNARESLHQYVSILVNLSNFLAPQIHVYDILETRPLQWSPILEAVSNTLISLTIATAVLNAREYHYDSD